MPGLNDTLWGGEYARWMAFSRYLTLIPLDTKTWKKNYSLPMENFPKCTAHTSLPCGRAHAFPGAWGGHQEGCCCCWIWVTGGGQRSWEVQPEQVTGSFAQEAMRGQLRLSGSPLPDHPQSGFSSIFSSCPGQPTLLFPVPWAVTQQEVNTPDDTEEPSLLSQKVRVDTSL